MAEVNNETKNVSSAKGIAGGYWFTAPLGTALPTAIDGTLDTKFVNQGFLSEDGISFSDEKDTEDKTDLNGEKVDSATTEISKGMTLTYLEVKKSAQAEQYGEANVTDANGVLDVKDTGEDLPHRCGVFKGVLKNGRKMMIVVPDCQLSELGDLQVGGGELFARECTYNLYKDATLNCYKRFIYESTETTAGAA